jgi:hypothetical protein
MDERTYAAIVTALAGAVERAEAAARRVPAGAWDEVVHTGDGAWTRKQLLAHMASNVLRQLIRVRIGAGIPEPDDEANHAEELEVAEWNAKRVAERSARTVDELVAEMWANRQALIALLDRLTPEQRARPMPFRGKPTPLEEMVPLLIGHLDQHAGELASGPGG